MSFAKRFLPEYRPVLLRRRCIDFARGRKLGSRAYNLEVGQEIPGISSSLEELCDVVEIYGRGYVMVGYNESELEFSDHLEDRMFTFSRPGLQVTRWPRCPTSPSYKTRVPTKEPKSLTTSSFCSSNVSAKWKLLTPLILGNIRSAVGLRPTTTPERVLGRSLNLTTRQGRRSSNELVMS